MSLSSVSSSWLRTKFAYWHSSETAIVSRSASASGSASCRASESQSACISGKLKSRLTSSASSPPKKSISCSGSRLTSPSSRPSPLRREMNERRCRRISCGSRFDVGDLARVDQERHGVHAEAVDAELEPEPGDLGDLVADPLVADVQVRLVRVEVMEEPLPGLLVEGPDAVLGVREHDRGLRRARRPVAPDVEVAEPVVGRGPRLAEPRVLVGRVVHDHVDDHAHAAVLRRPDQRDEVSERAEPRIDAVVVGDVVAVVAVRGGLERHQPQAADPDPRQVVDALRQAADVADAVAVPVEERLDVEAVDHRVLPPQVARLCRRHWITSGRTCSPNTSMNRSCSLPT